MAHKHIQVHGVVQGVGFRPYVRNLAVACGLRGYVCNAPAGVVAEVQGADAAVADFLQRLPRQAPPLARIDGVEIHDAEPQVLAPGFLIRPSLHATVACGARLECAPDTAPCAACRADYAGPGRRSGYAFTNCTHCGPRYTIVAALPYDRERTTMAGFRQCPACAREYANPADRRFHAQPNACPVCGPTLQLGAHTGADALTAAAQLLGEGGIIALKNVGGYQLACDARNPAPVARLRQNKQRVRKPFALLARDLAAAARLCRMDAGEQAALTSRARPIVLLDKWDAAPAWTGAVAPAQPRLGIMLPSSPLHDLLMSTPGVPDLLVMTSGNSGGEPLVYREAEAASQLAPLADAVLAHDRPIHAPVDDSVVYCFAGRERLVRRARGYAPAAITVPNGEGGVVFAAGAELKGAFCILADERAYLSPYLGDMDRLEALERWARTADHFLNLLQLTGSDITALAYDPHPGYQVSRWARAWARRNGITRHRAVQHHHAHVAACMAEHGLTGRVLGVTWDGTGYGEDGAIWGGEFLLAEGGLCQRRARLRPVALTGGDGAVRHPWRAALSYLIASLGLEPAAALARRLWPELKGSHIDLLCQRAVQSSAGLACSAAGRLFDAVAALAGVAPECISYEGEAAIALENACGRSADTGSYPFPYVPGESGTATFGLDRSRDARTASLTRVGGRASTDGRGGPLCSWPLPAVSIDELDWRPLIAALVADLAQGCGIETVAVRFHNSLAAGIATACEAARQASGPNRVCLAGGSFQNRRLLGATLARLWARNFEVYVPAQVPANDGGLALGQAMVARALLAAEPAHQENAVCV